MSTHRHQKHLLADAAGMVASVLSGRQIDENGLTIRYTGANRDQVRRGLVELGSVRAVDPQRMFVVEFADKEKKTRAEELLRRLEQQGMVEFFAPLLRDARTHELQLLTDEITVRFKPDMASRYLSRFKKKYGLSETRQNEFVPDQYLLRISHPEGLQTVKVAWQLQDEPEVEFATPNLVSQFRR